MVKYLSNRTQKTLAVVHQSLQAGSLIVPKPIRLAISGFTARYYHAKSQPFFDRESELLTVRFTNPVLDKINLPGIFQCSTVRKLYPLDNNKRKNIKVVFTYEKPASSAILNHSSYLRSLHDVNAIRETLKNPCLCSNSSFIYEPSQHIFTGNLASESLRDVFRKGTKYRLIRAWNRERITDSLQLDVNQFILRLSRKHKIPTGKFTPYKEKAMELFQQALDTHSITYPKIKFLQLKQEVASLHSEYVISTADKATGNYVFIRKKYCLEVIC